MPSNIGELNGASLAYLGDAVLELLVRRYLVQSGEQNLGRLNRRADAYVCAAAQSRAIERILPLLNEEELAAFKRGRNTHSQTVPKSATVSEYRRATGMESLFGFLYLSGQIARTEALFSAAYASADGESPS